MKTLKTITLMVLALFGAMISGARAEIAAGTYSMEFDGSVSLWDISGTYSETIDGMAMDYTLSVDASGKVTGHGSASMDSGAGDIDMEFDLSGMVKSSGSITRVELSMNIKGSGTIEGYEFTLKMSMKEKMEIDTETFTMIGTVSGKMSISVKGMGSESMRIDPTDIEMELPFDMDGSWTMNVDVTPNGTKIAGTGQIILSNGTTYGFSISGSYKAKTDLSKIQLKGTGTNKSISLKAEAKCEGPSMDLENLKGKALGQKLTYSGGV
jgi:hypothetical protein